MTWDDAMEEMQVRARLDLARAEVAKVYAKLEAQTAIIVRFMHDCDCGAADNLRIERPDWYRGGD